METDVGLASRLKVQRKDGDFYTLRRFLIKQFPYVVIPPLPLKNTRILDKLLMKRQKQFTRFLQAITRSEVLKSSNFLQGFVGVTDYKQFTAMCKAEEKTKYSRIITDVVNENGRANVKMIQNSAVFASKMGAFIDSHQILY